MLAGLLVACGITLGEGDEETELFRRIVVEGDLIPGAELKLGVDYSQPYPVALDVVCELLTLEPLMPTPEGTETPESRRPAPPTEVRIPALRPTPEEKVLDILITSIGPNAEGGPADEATPVLGSISRRFRAPTEPGRYSVECYTPADDNNQISKTIRIEPGPTATP